MDVRDYTKTLHECVFCEYFSVLQFNIQQKTELKKINGTGKSWLGNGSLRWFEIHNKLPVTRYVMSTGSH